MTIEEMEQSLPNGFHDALLEKLTIDYSKGKVTFELFVDIGNPASPKSELQELARSGVLSLTGVLYCVIEPPEPLTRQEVQRLWIADSGPIESLKNQIKLPSPVPVGAFTHYFFINEWNAYITISAMDASFEWRD